jgi:CII-binding regulator of phage lambda lysogenization HflD
MMELSYNVKKSNDTTDKLEKKIDHIQDNVKTVEDKSKFDILQWVSNNFIGVVMAIGAIAYLVSQFIK